jgi:hypothetical protein
MVLTKKKSFSLNNTSINRSRKINRFSQEGSGDRKPEQIELEKKVGENKKYKDDNRLNLFIGFNEYYRIDVYKSEVVSPKVIPKDFYIYKTESYGFYLDSYDSLKNLKKFNSLQELSNEINNTLNPNVINKKLSLRNGGLPVCLVNQYRVYQMTTNDVQKRFLKKISRYLTDSSKTRFIGGGSEDTLEIIKGGAESEESPLVRALNNLLSIELIEDISRARVKRIVDKLIEKMFSEIDKSYPEGEGENERKRDLEREINEIFTKYLNDFLRNVDKLQNNEVKQHLEKEFKKEILTNKLEARAGFQDKKPSEFREEAQKNQLKYNERFHSEFIYQEGYTAPKNLFGSFGVESNNIINFYVRKAFGFTESEIEERHQSYMILVIYESNLLNLIKKVIETFEFLRDSIYEDGEGKKSKESVFYDIITKNFIRLRKRNYENIKGWQDDTLKGESQKKILSVFAIEFYSASRKVPVSSIIEFIKMLIEYTLFKYKELQELQEFQKEGITYQLINKKEVEAIIGDEKLEAELAEKKLKAESAKKK